MPAAKSSQEYAEMKIMNIIHKRREERKTTQQENMWSSLVSENVICYHFLFSLTILTMLPCFYFVSCFQRFAPETVKTKKNVVTVLIQIFENKK